MNVLETAGFRVIVPPQSLCCGRPLYDFGMLDTAKSLLKEILQILRPYIAAGVPLVGLEPSCVAVFRDELTNLFPHDQDAQRLRSQSYVLSEFLLNKAPDFRPPQLDRKAMLHVHCHQKALIKQNHDQQLLERMGVDVEPLDSGCCGMAGSFGFEKEHYDVSLAVGELKLLPKVRELDKHTVVVADGFSCREQIMQTTDRRALHVAQVLDLAQKQAARLPQAYPEAICYDDAGRAPQSNSPRSAFWIGAGFMLLGAATAWRVKTAKSGG